MPTNKSARHSPPYPAKDYKNIIKNGNEKKQWDQFYFILNDACDITEVGFASYDDFETDDLDIFIDRVIVCRTDNDWRLRGFYDYATEYIKDALDNDKHVQEDKIDYRNSI